MSSKLTSRQIEVLNIIKSHISKSGIPPTRAEISSALGFNSLNSAEMHIKALVKKGALIAIPGVSRGLRINPAFESEFLDSVKDELSNSEASNDFLSLPIVGRVAAGSPIEAIEHLEDQLLFHSSIFSQTPDYLLRVKGDSMIDIGIMEDDLLAVKRADEANNRQVIVARLDGEVTVKRLRKLPDHIELIPENSAYKPIVIRPDQDFSIEGIAVGLIRNHGLD
ncbi:transcriptional repressor LexA [Taylorella equigenitalis]|uniref:transcriptional repressor LexA n=1 Tax=Taylorella equigenitalis TaxID=29575 RepID=UPI0003F5469A|nr:transcriptional repressor LexA [Taylorella equigenitalis]WDU47243.1 transcriptional repressor LexA [Taylorella equigenitalis]